MDTALSQGSVLEHNHILTSRSVWQHERPGNTVSEERSSKNLKKFGHITSFGVVVK